MRSRCLWRYRTLLALVADRAAGTIERTGNALALLGVILAAGIRPALGMLKFDAEQSFVVRGNDAFQVGGFGLFEIDVAERQRHGE